MPKLLVHGQPGVVVGPGTLAWCRLTQPALTVADVGPAGHFLPEDRPAEVTAALAAWLDGQDAASTEAPASTV